MQSWFFTLCLALIAATTRGIEPPASPESSSPVVAPANEAGGAAAADPSQRRVLDHVVVIGASISAGFNTSGMMGLPAANLADVLRKMLPPGARVESYADTLLFEDPQARGAKQVSRARKAAPTAIIAVDFPFWWSYGFWFDEEDRLAVLERGLNMLLGAREGVAGPGGKPIPILISLLPDTHGLTGPTVPHALQTPDVETLAKCNQRLRDWAAKNEGVIIVPLLEDFDRLRARQKVRLGTAELDPNTIAFMQPDGLHTTVEGLVFVACRCVESMESAGLVEKGSIAFEDPVGLAARLRAEGVK
ncbi:MAG: SGNH/GDSL hydrolase family protein [Phycisphaerales bacterium]|nr:SGNH/GDSL hydrolase family protein [Phycisphaerales bacterium]